MNAEDVDQDRARMPNLEKRSRPAKSRHVGNAEKPRLDAIMPDISLCMP
jgi:hypothetical protein